MDSIRFEKITRRPSFYFFKKSTILNHAHSYPIQKENYTKNDRQEKMRLRVVTTSQRTHFGG
jgi:hypothetical protein